MGGYKDPVELQGNIAEVVDDVTQAHSQLTEGRNIHNYMCKLDLLYRGRHTTARNNTNHSGPHIHHTHTT